MKRNLLSIALSLVLCAASTFSCNAGNQKRPDFVAPKKSELLDAVINNSLIKVRDLLNFSPSDWLTSDVTGEAFVLAGELGHIEIMNMLIQLPLGQRPRAEHITEVINEAVMADKLPVFKFLVKMMDKKAIDDALFVAAFVHHLKIMNFLLELPGDKRPDLQARISALETISREIPQLQIFFRNLPEGERLSEESFNKALNIAIESDPSFREARENLQSEYLESDIDDPKRLNIIEDYFTVENYPSFGRVGHNV